MKDINRHALVLTAKPAFFALLSSVSGDVFEAPHATENDTSRVYLISGDFLYHDEALEWLEANCQAFFEDTFLSWYEDESKCPNEVNWSQFQDYFVFSIQSMVIDAASNEMLYQDD